MKLCPRVLQTICRPWHCGLYRAGRSRELCRNKTTSAFMARFDLVLSSELCRLSNRHGGKTPPDNPMLFSWSVTERRLTVNQSRGRSSHMVHRCITERKMRKRRENQLCFRTGVSDLGLSERFGQVEGSRNSLVLKKYRCVLVIFNLKNWNYSYLHLRFS